MNLLGLYFFQCIYPAVSQNKQSEDESTTLAPLPPGSIEIVRIYQPPGVSNGVKLVWGVETKNLNLNITYGVHYGTGEENISGTNHNFH